VSITIVTCAGGAVWEAPLVRGLQRAELGVRVARRCVDHGELLGVALRDRPHAAVLAAELPWLDRDLVGTLQDAGVAVVAVESRDGVRPVDAVGVSYRVGPATTAEELAGLLHRIGAAGEDRRERVDEPDEAPTVHARGNAGRTVVVWGAPGAPGRTTVATHLAIEYARAGRSTTLVDGDTWSASIAQLLGLNESPAVTNAVRLAGDGWPHPLESCLHDGPHGVRVLPGLARADLWPEVRERSWQAVLDATRDRADVVVVDVAAPIDEDEELSFDRAPFRRNVMTRAALRDADAVFVVVGGDPVGLRRGIFAWRDLGRELPAVAERALLVVNRAPASPRRLQECSVELERWTGEGPRALLPVEPSFEHAVWEGRALQDVARRSPWLRELRALATVPLLRADEVERSIA
jgi:MinD-like ATPase involved in chromosome partitioning or flagellar assembly